MVSPKQNITLPSLISGIDGKWKLIIGSEHPRHWGIISSLSALVESGKSKAELLAEREILQAEDVA